MGISIGKGEGGFLDTLFTTPLGGGSTVFNPTDERYAKKIEKLNYDVSPNLATYAGVATIGAASSVPELLATLKPATDLLGTAKDTIAVASNPKKYINDLIPDSLKDIYQSIDSVINEILPAPTKTIAAAPVSTFNSPAQVLAINNNKTALIVGGIASLMIIYLLMKGKK